MPGILVFLSAFTCGAESGAAPALFAGYSMELNGDTEVVGEVLRLTSDGVEMTDKNQVGSAFMATPYTIGHDTSLTTRFTFHIWGGDASNGGSGFTFLLQNSPSGADTLGWHSSLGYFMEIGGRVVGGISNSLAVEFDTFHNSDPSHNDPGPSHVGIDINGLPGPVAASNIYFNDPGRRYVWIDYDGAADVLSIYLAGFIDPTGSFPPPEKPSAPILSRTVDLFSIVGPQAYVGCTSATGFSTNIHDIEAWELNVSQGAPTVVPLPAPLWLLGAGYLSYLGLGAGRRQTF